MKKGFTLIELLAVIMILAVLLAIAVPQILNTIENSRIKLYTVNDKGLVEAANKYFTTDINAPTIEVGETLEIPINTLIDKDYISTIKKPHDSNIECNGYVLITRLKEDEYDTTPNINCEDLGIVSRQTDKLLAYYKFDDFQEPTENLYTLSSDLFLTSSTYSTIVYDGLEKEWTLTKKVGFDRI
jgi:prepilin-type N-terminal cleavage/methylation domain-containing protein